MKRIISILSVVAILALLIPTSMADEVSPPPMPGQEETNQEETPPMPGEEVEEKQTNNETIANKTPETNKGEPSGGILGLIQSIINLFSIFSF